MQRYHSFIHSPSSPSLLFQTFQHTVNCAPSALFGRFVLLRSHRFSFASLLLLIYPFILYRPLSLIQTKGRRSTFTIRFILQRFFLFFVSFMSRLLFFRFVELTTTIVVAAVVVSCLPLCVCIKRKTIFRFVHSFGLGVKRRILACASRNDSVYYRKEKRDGKRNQRQNR